MHTIDSSKEFQNCKHQECHLSQHCKCCWSQSVVLTLALSWHLTHIDRDSDLAGYKLSVRRIVLLKCTTESFCWTSERRVTCISISWASCFAPGLSWPSVKDSASLGNLSCNSSAAGMRSLDAKALIPSWISAALSFTNGFRCSSTTASVTGTAFSETSYMKDIVGVMIRLYAISGSTHTGPQI